MKLRIFPELGEATAEKLRENGYDDILSLAVASPKALSELAGIGEGAAVKIIASARKFADVGNFESGEEIVLASPVVLQETTRT